MMEDKPEMSELSLHVQEPARGSAEGGVEVTPGKPQQTSFRPEPLPLPGHTRAKMPALEDEPITDLPDLTDLPPEVQEFITRLAQRGIEVTPGRPDPNRILPEPLRLNTSLSAAVIEERDEYGR